MRKGSTAPVAVGLALIALVLLGMLGSRYLRLVRTGPRPGTAYVPDLSAEAGQSSARGSSR
jgi:hypothetical protein